MKTIKIGKEDISVNQIFKYHKDGFKLLCAKCGEELSGAFTKEEAREKSISPGVYCGNDLNHVNIHFNLGHSEDIQDILNNG